jgi:hypothetical protein
MVAFELSVRGSHQPVLGYCLSGASRTYEKTRGNLWFGARHYNLDSMCISNQGLFLGSTRHHAVRQYISDYEIHESDANLVQGNIGAEHCSSGVQPKASEK